jgi:hypothetical protein
MEYKIEAFGQVWSAQGLCEKATARANDLSRDGWRIVRFEKGWSGFWFSSLYVVFERQAPRNK